MFCSEEGFISAVVPLNPARLTGEVMVGVRTPKAPPTMGLLGLICQGALGGGVPQELEEDVLRLWPPEAAARRRAVRRAALPLTSTPSLSGDRFDERRGRRGGYDSHQDAPLALVAGTCSSAASMRSHCSVPRDDATPPGPTAPHLTAARRARWVLDYGSSTTNTHHPQVAPRCPFFAGAPAVRWACAGGCAGVSARVWRERFGASAPSSVVRRLPRPRPAAPTRRCSSAAGGSAAAVEAAAAMIARPSGPARTASGGAPGAGGGRPS